MENPFLAREKINQNKLPISIDNPLIDNRMLPTGSIHRGDLSQREGENVEK